VTRRRWAIAVMAAETMAAVWLTPRAVRALSFRMMRPLDASPS